MVKKEIDKDILENAREIKKYCEGRECENCRFYKKYGNNKCILSANSPMWWEIPEKEILDKVEKEYLWNVIKPFKDRILNITKKIPILLKNKEYIEIKLKDDSYFCCLPIFKKNEMYINMELNREYTVKELFGGK